MPGTSALAARSLQPLSAAANLEIVVHSLLLKSEQIAPQAQQATRGFRRLAFREARAEAAPVDRANAGRGTRETLTD
jgi:hypothetical protein